MRKKTWLSFLLSMVLILTVFPAPFEQVEAGVTMPRLDMSNVRDASVWNNVSGDITAIEGKLVIPENSTEYTRYITKTVAKADKFYDNLVGIWTKINFTKLPVGKTFAIAFGLQDIESGLEEPGNVEVRFTNQNGIHIGVVAYDKEGNPVTVCKSKSSGMVLNNVSTVKAEISTGGKITIWVNNQEFCSGKLPITGEGRVGFLQTGDCRVEIHDIGVTFYKYDRPENVNVKEDFEKEAMDISKLVAKAISFSGYFPRQMSLMEYKGSRVLMMENTGVAYIGTQYSYSNFEITFDIPYLKTTHSCDNTGKIASAKTERFGIAFGGDRAEWTQAGYDYATDMVTFANGTVYSKNWKDKYSAKHDYWQSEKPISVKVSVVDGLVTAGLKYMNDKDYEDVLSYQLTNGTPTGHVHIWLPSSANMAIDNVTIKNLDDSPALIETEYQSGLITATDAVYEPFERVYAPGTEETLEEQTKEQKFPWLLLIPLTAVVGGMAVAVTAVIAHRKQKKEETSDEKSI